jgi:DMSO/TMAO reductase YedYZ molybdopterin-dependent catalytic subunit
MSKQLSRRRLITTGLAAAAGASGLAVAARLADRYGLIPPDHVGIYGVGETLNYASHRLLMSGHSLAREFKRGEISKTPHVNGDPPRNGIYKRLLARRFADWNLNVEGMVAHPSSFSLADLKSFPMSTQITQLACEEGWSYIAEWKGVRLADVLNVVGVLPRAKYMVYTSLDPEWWDSLDLAEAWHPQTLLTYGMNGQDLPEEYGAPLRMRVPRQLGYKSVKHLNRLILTDNLKGFGKGLGSSAPEQGFAWYAGI